MDFVYTHAMSFHEEQKRYWDSKTHLKRRDPTHPVIRAYVEKKLALLRSVTDLKEPVSSMDVGAGNGYFSYYLNEWGNCLATDYSEVMLVNNPVPDKRVVDARTMEIADNTFDLTFCHAVLHHIDRNDRLDVVKEMARTSKKYVMIIEPNRYNPIMAGFSILKKEEHGGLDFSLSYVKKLATDAGLTIVKACSWGALTPNRMPFSSVLLPMFQVFERPLLLGVTNIVIAEKR